MCIMPPTAQTVIGVGRRCDGHFFQWGLCTPLDPRSRLRATARIRVYIRFILFAYGENKGKSILYEKKRLLGERK
jgi:hypothetical protein